MPQCLPPKTKNAKTPDDEIQELLRSAAAYLQDATNLKNAPHTRFSSAMNALGCVYAAGVGDESDREQVILWERARYESAAAPREEAIEAAIAHVTQRLTTAGWKN